MDLSSISKYYILRPLTVSPDQLLLDPNNPRIVLDVNTDRKFTPNELIKSDVQQYILSVINKQTHHIAELIRGIRASGFIDGGNDMIARRIPNTDKYLVIEGNRRTTAIKHLLNDSKNLNSTILDTLTAVHVKEFVYKSNPEFTEEAVIDILLGKIHIDGPLPWGALESAYYIYNSYLREMKSYTRDSQFQYIPQCAREVAALFNLTANGVRKKIKVYRVYEQLKEQRYEVRPHHFSLIDMAITDRELSEKYFELRPETFHFSNRGLARFDWLCIRDKKPINNPEDFKGFAKVFRHGTGNDLILIESNEKSIAAVLERLEDRLEEREFLNHLKDIRERIEALRPADFRGLNAELDHIREIKRLVDGKLWNLTRG